jgi:hypothetical protein
MYACNCETERGFFEGVVHAQQCSRPIPRPTPPSLKRRLVLPCSTFSGQVFARNTITVAIEVVRIAWVLLEHPLGLFVRFEACAVEVAVSPTPRSGRLRRRWRFRLRAGASPFYAVVPVGLLAQLPCGEPPTDLCSPLLPPFGPGGNGPDTSHWVGSSLLAHTLPLLASR